MTYVGYGWRRLLSLLRVGILRLRGARIGKRVILETSLAEVPANRIVIGDGCVIEKHVIVGRLSSLSLGDYVKVKEGTRISGVDTHPKSLEIGDNSWIGEETIINTNEGVNIEGNVGIGARTQVWTHGYFPNTSDGYPSKTGNVVMKNGVWLPPSCIILPDVVIGANTIVGTGSVVTKSLPDNVFATGVPCQVKQADQWKYRARLDSSKKMAIIKKGLVQGVNDLGFKVVDAGQGRFIVSKYWYKFCADFSGDYCENGYKRQVSFVADGLPKQRRAAHTVIDITHNIYTKTGTLAEWIVIRTLLDRCILRLAAEQN